MIYGMSIQAWMRSNARLFRHAGTALTYRKDVGRILLAGPFAGALSPFFHTFAPDARIDVLSTAVPLPAAIWEDECGEVSFPVKDTYDFIAAPLHVMFLSSKSLASFLLDCHDALDCGGILYISFADSPAATVGMVDYPSWYSDEILRLRFHFLPDMLQALGCAGFSVRDLQMDRCDGLGRVVTMILGRQQRDV